MPLLRGYPKLDGEILIALEAIGRNTVGGNSPLVKTPSVEINLFLSL